MPIHGYPGNVITANPTAPTSSVATGVWTTEQQLIATAAGNWPFTIPTQQISRSLRFNSADSAYLNRTPASASNRRTWTWSGWVKQGLLGIDSALFDAANNDQFRFRSDNTFSFSFNNTLALQTTQVFRDTSAWRHFVVVADTTQATSSNRLKIYINGVQITAFSTASYPAQNTEGFINSTSAHSIGRTSGGAYYFNGYLTEVNFIDGQALTPSSFGQTNASTGVWEPIPYTGTYGTNGFYVNFSDNSGTTSTTLGKDYSGNGNNWTPNNFSVTAGAGNDSLVDSPTSYGTDTGVGGTVRGNYCTWNPLDKNTNVTINNGNLDAIYTGSVDVYGCFSTFSVSSGKWYAEFTATSLGGSSYPLVGIHRSSGSSIYSANFIPETYVNLKAGTSDNRGTAGPTFTAFVNGDVLGIAFNADSGEIFFSKNGTFLNSGDPVAGTGEFFSGLTDGPFKFGIGTFSSRTAIANFGQRAFAYTAPSGFKALCTQNLPTPTIGATSTTQADNYFGISLYTGTGSQQSITGLEFQPDFFWSKGRSAANAHVLINAVNGPTKFLSSNNTDAEVTTTNGTLVSFNSNGVTLQADTNGYANFSGRTYVAWQWKANGAGGSNTAGTITSTVSANTTSGFSIVTYTGTGANATVGHGLGVAPSMVIVKNRTDGTRDWLVYHASVGNTAAVFLNLTNASTTNSAYWNNTSPTSSVFSLGNSSAGNGSTNNLVAYCFAPVAGYSAFGSYTGNGSTDGPFVYTGFRPEFVMVKRTDVADEWYINDAVRNPSNVAGLTLRPNTSAAEANYAPTIDMLSNGFKVRQSGAGYNASGGTYIYACFAENPFKYSLAR